MSIVASQKMISTDGLIRPQLAINQTEIKPPSDSAVEQIMGSLSRKVRRNNGSQLVKLLFQTPEPPDQDAALERAKLLKKFELSRIMGKHGGVGSYWRKLLAHHQLFYKQLRQAQAAEQEEPQADQLVNLVDDILLLREAEQEIRAEQAEEKFARERKAAFLPNLL